MYRVDRDESQITLTDTNTQADLPPVQIFDTPKVLKIGEKTNAVVEILKDAEAPQDVDYERVVSKVIDTYTEQNLPSVSVFKDVV